MTESLRIHSLPFPGDTVELYARIRKLPLPALLSSGTNPEHSARFDILTADPSSVLRCRGQKTMVEYANGVYEVKTGNPFEILAGCFGPARLDIVNPDLPFTGGALGYFSYGLLNRKYRIRQNPEQDDIKLPDMLVGIYDWALIVDHKKQLCTLVAQPEVSDTRFQQLITRLESPPVGEHVAGFSLRSSFNSNFTKQQYLYAYNRIIDYIYAGDCYQVNLAQRFTAQCEGDPLSGFCKLQETANAPFAAFLEDGDFSVLSFSPERFIRVEDRQVMTQPIKGTRPRGVNSEDDNKNLQDLLTSSKDMAENLMIVDLLRNDLGHVCKTGSVKVKNLFEAQSFQNVHHLVSTILGELDDANDVFRLLEASFPGGSITGTPKIRSMEIINELESRPRSVYCGSIAYIDRSGNMDSNICIRTLVKDRNTIHCWGGGGIVADSSGEAEYQETLDKISVFMEGLSG